MAIALGMQIGEQGVKKTEEILATLKEANNLMDDMQSDILDQRKKLSRIADKVKQAQSTANRGREALKYFAQQATKDVCIIIMISLISLAVLGLLILTWQISNEQAEIEMSPEEAAERNYKELNVQIDAKGNVTVDKDPEQEIQESMEEQETRIVYFVWVGMVLWGDYGLRLFGGSERVVGRICRYKDRMGGIR